MKHNRFNKRDNSYLKHKKELFEEMKGRCGYCGCELDYKKATIDHKVPLSIGGTNDKYNLLICCWSCNHYKQRRDVEGFRKSVANTIKRLNCNSAYRLALKYERIKEEDINKDVVFYFERRK
ncbi:HNH endonuclease [Brachyspira alvinipulli]|uniref:HNH endonuclease n=1 Tax=Brachyspira alvinipulli TaxID=84379 RepID=UPI0004BAF503|nr:HNH endonuclease signature motif containing protein [Brachyspira alvinipulli]